MQGVHPMGNKAQCLIEIYGRGIKLLKCLNYTKLRQLIIKKIIKIIATRCHNLRLKCTKFDFSWGSAPDPAGGAYSAPRPPSCI